MKVCFIFKLLSTERFVKRPVLGSIFFEALFIERPEEKVQQSKLEKKVLFVKIGNVSKGLYI